MLDIEYHSQIPKEMQRAIEPVIDKYKWLIPQWCYNLTVKYWDTATDEKGKAKSAAAQIYVVDDYRFASLEVYSEWFDGDEKQREYYIIHEFVHLHNCLPGNFFNRLLDNLYPEEPDRGPAYKIAKEEHRRLVEQATQDLAWIIINREYKPITNE
jgi:hypothetical protein